MAITTPARADDIAAVDIPAFIDDVCQAALDGEAIGIEDRKSVV